MSIQFRCKKCKRQKSLKWKVCDCGAKLAPPNVSYYVRVKNHKGKFQSKLCPTLKDAQAQETVFKSNKARRVIVGKTTAAPTFDYVWEKYMGWAKQNKRSWNKDEQRYNDHIKEHLPGTLDQLTPIGVQDIIEKMQTKKKSDGKKYSPAMVTQVFRIMTRIYSWAKDMKLYTGISPCANIKLEEFDNSVEPNVSPARMKKLLKAVKEDENQRAALVIGFGIFTGRRKGEILSLKWENVNVYNSSASFDGSTTKNKKRLWIPLSENAMAIVESSRAVKLSQWVFPSSAGGYYHSFTRTWHRIRKAAGVSDLRFHDLRHAYASYLASSGEIDIYTLKKLLGHKSIVSTQRYAHLFDDALQRGTDVMSDMFDY